MRGVGVLLCLCAAACNQTGASTSNEDAAIGSNQPVELAGESVGQMLRAGKPDACAHPQVKEFLLSKLTEIDDATLIRANTYHDKPSFEQEDIDTAREQTALPRMAEYQALQSNQSVGEVTCGVNIYYANRSYPETGQYILRPSLEDPDEFLAVTRFASVYPGQIAALATKLYEERSPQTVPDEHSGEEVEADNASAPAEPGN